LSGQKKKKICWTLDEESWLVVSAILMFMKVVS
jgi:hypothetical protein